MNTEPTTIVGLDLDEVPARLIVAKADEAVPYVLEHRSFRSEKQFRGYWQTLFGNRHDVRLAVSSQGSDALNLLSWLDNQGAAIEVHRYPAGMFRCAQNVGADFAIWNLPRAYETAYTLALWSAYRLHAASVAGRLWTSVFSVEELLEEMKQELHRLAAALPETPPKREVDCPS